MPVCKVFINTQPVIIIEDEYYEVDIYIENMKLKKNIAYIHGDMVYVYRGKAKNENDMVSPGIYKKDGEVVFVKPPHGHEKKYSIDNINELSVNNIFNTVEEEVDSFIQPSDIEVINNNLDIFTPTIKEGDDFLKYIVKKAILDKKINLKNYKDRFTNEYALNNMKSGLNKSTKMTVPNFVKWCEILGLDWSMVITDNGDDTVNPLSENIHVSNKT